MTKSPLQSRRRFIRSSTEAAALAAMFPFVSRGKVLGANDRIGLGFIGVGQRGATHVAVVQKLIQEGENLRIAGATDAYRYRLEETIKAAGGTAWRRDVELVAAPEVDAVCVATPDRHHMRQGLMAVSAGKDVYCEKPMCHWSQFDQAREFCDAARKLGRVVQIGDQGNSSPGWVKVKELFASGAVGRLEHVRAGYYRRGDFAERMPIPDPEAKPGPDLDWEAFLGDAPRVPFTVERFFSWRRYLDYAGGPCTDLWPHVLTPFVCALGLGFPESAAAVGGIYKFTTYDREVPDTFDSALGYAGHTVSLTATLANVYATEPAIRGDEGTMTFQNAGGWESGFDSVTVIPASGAPKVVAGKRGDPTPEHWKNFIRCVRTREQPVSSAQEFLKVQAALNMSMLSYRHRKVARFDAGERKIIGV
jgi:predicted dehydrogenase